jgi:tetratricopeptide (TPR) repeat protein
MPPLVRNAGTIPAASPSVGEGRHFRLIPLLLMAWTLVLYAKALRGPFLFDDEHFIQKNTYVQNFGPLEAIYTTSVTEGAHIPGNFYRPNQQLLYAVLGASFGFDSPLPFHLTSILLHGANASLLWLLLCALGMTPVAAAVGAAFFACHPVQSEAVAYISGLSDPLALFFILLALNVHARLILGSPKAGASGGWWPALPLISVLAVLACTSKESGVVLAPLVLAQTAYGAWTRRGRPTRLEGQALAIVVLVAAAFTLLKLTLLDFGDVPATAGADALYRKDLFLRLQNFVMVLYDYAKILVWPDALYYEKPYALYADFWTARGAFGLLTIAASMGLFAWGLARRPLVALGVAMTWAAFLPFMGIVPINAIWLEHWLYMPMVGISLLVAEAARSLPAAKPLARPAYALLLVLCLALSWRSFDRAGEWADVETFYLNEIRHSGGNQRSFNNLAMHYADVGSPEKAIEYYQNAIAAAAVHGRPLPQPHHNLGRAYASLGRWNEALVELRRALAIDPSFIYSLAFLHQITTAARDEARSRLLEDAIGRLQRGETYDYQALDAALFGH